MENTTIIQKRENENGKGVPFSSLIIIVMDFSNSN